MIYRQTDESGLFVADVFEIPKGANPELYLSVDPAQGFYHPKWDGKEWIEGLSQAEIDAIQNVQPPPTDQERITALEMAVLEIISGGAT